MKCTLLWCVHYLSLDSTTDTYVWSHLFDISYQDNLGSQYCYYVCRYYSCIYDVEQLCWCICVCIYDDFAVYYTCLLCLLWQTNLFISINILLVHTNSFVSSLLQAKSRHSAIVSTVTSLNYCINSHLTKLLYQQSPH